MMTETQQSETTAAAISADFAGRSRHETLLADVLADVQLCSFAIDFGDSFDVT